MKISKFTRLVKQTGYCFVADVQGSGMWLGNGHALFRAASLPLMEGREQVRTVLDIPDKAWEKIVLEEESYLGTTNVKGLDLSDCAQNERQTKKVRVSACLDGKWTSCRRCDDGELIFYRDGLLALIMDDIEESDYITYTARRTVSGQPYLAIHDGMNLLAVIMPMQVVSDTYLAELAEFQALCTEQLWREKAIASRQTNPGDQIAETDGEQTGMEGQCGRVVEQPDDE